MPPNRSSPILSHAPPPPDIYALSLHDALPIYVLSRQYVQAHSELGDADPSSTVRVRSEEHTSELQSHHDLVCRLLLEKKNTTITHFFLIRIMFPTYSSSHTTQNLVHAGSSRLS